MDKASSGVFPPFFLKCIHYLTKRSVKFMTKCFWESRHLILLYLVFVGLVCLPRTLLQTPLTRVKKTLKFFWAVAPWFKTSFLVAMHNIVADLDQSTPELIFLGFEESTFNSTFEPMYPNQTNIERKLPSISVW